MKMKKQQFDARYVQPRPFGSRLQSSSVFELPERSDRHRQGRQSSLSVASSQTAHRPISVVVLPGSLSTVTCRLNQRGGW